MRNPVHVSFIHTFFSILIIAMGFFFFCVCVYFRATVGRSAPDGEVHSLDGSLHCEKRRCSAAQQHGHHAHLAL